MNSENTTQEDIQAFVNEKWNQHKVQFALLSHGNVRKQLILQTHHLKNILEESEKGDYKAPEFKDAWQNFLIQKIDNLKQDKNTNGSKPSDILPNSTNLDTETGIQVEKIDWQGSQTEPVFLIDILFALPKTGLSNTQYKQRWKTTSQHFTVKGKDVTPASLTSTFSNLGINKIEGTPRNYKIYDELAALFKSHQSR